MRTSARENGGTMTTSGVVSLKQREIVGNGVSVSSCRRGWTADEVGYAVTLLSRIKASEVVANVACTLG
jgi:hypothetical protein